MVIFLGHNKKIVISNNDNISIDWIGWIFYLYFIPFLKFSGIKIFKIYFILD